MDTKVSKDVFRNNFEQALRDIVYVYVDMLLKHYHFRGVK